MSHHRRYAHHHPPKETPCPAPPPRAPAATPARPARSMPSRCPLRDIPRRTSSCRTSSTSSFTRWDSTDIRKLGARSSTAPMRHVHPGQPALGPTRRMQSGSGLRAPGSWMDPGSPCGAPSFSSLRLLRADCGDALSPIRRLGPLRPGQDEVRRSRSPPSRCARPRIPQPEPRSTGFAHVAPIGAAAARGPCPRGGRRHPASTSRRSG